MITKVKFDGETHLAVVFHSSVSWEDLQGDINGLLNLVSIACNNENEVCTDAVYSAINIIRSMQPSTNNAFEMQKALFSESLAPEPMKLKHCEIYLE